MSLWLVHITCNHVILKSSRNFRFLNQSIKIRCAFIMIFIPLEIIVNQKQLHVLNTCVCTWIHMCNRLVIICTSIFDLKQIHAWSLNRCFIVLLKPFQYVRMLSFFLIHVQWRAWKIIWKVYDGVNGSKPHPNKMPETNFITLKK